MKKILLLGVAVAGAVALVGCDTSITAAICTDATTVSTSGLALNANQKLALSGIMSSCASTNGGTTFSNSTVALAIIQDAILLQSSGLLSNVHITALAPEQQQTLRRIKGHWSKLSAGYLASHDTQRRE